MSSRRRSAARHGWQFLRLGARRPEGPWSDPVWIDPHGIDPSFLFDGGDVYYTRNGKGADFDHPVIYARPRINVKTGKLLEKSAADLEREREGSGPESAAPLQDLETRIIS